MSLAQSMALVFSLLPLCACASAPGDIDSPSGPKAPIRGGIAEFSLGSFDGEVAKGRVLVGATAEPFVIDGRLVEWIDVEIRNIKNCGTSEPLGHYLFDVIAKPPRPEQLVTIRPNSWYGAQVRFVLFSKRRSKELPDCFKGDLMVWAQGARLAATLPIQVSRTDKPPASPPPSSPPVSNPDPSPHTDPNP